MGKTARWQGAINAVDQVTRMVAIDAAIEEGAERSRQQRSSLPLEQLKDRDLSTRALDATHVAALAASIADIGLIHPIAVDTTGVLLAGAHRLAAVRVLHERHEDAFLRWFGDGIPVMMIDVGAGEEGRRRALAIELSENEKRKDYTREEILALADRLRAAGYHDHRGRPRGGEKALGPALSLVLGKSLRTVRRLLQEPTAPTAADERQRSAARRCERALRTCLATMQRAHPVEDNHPLVIALREAQRRLAVWLRGVVPRRRARGVVPSPAGK